MKKFKRGQVVRCGSNAVLVTGKGNSKEGKNLFAGVVIMSMKNFDDDAWPVGMYSDTWSIEPFWLVDFPISKVTATWLLRT